MQLQFRVKDGASSIIAVAPYTGSYAFRIRLADGNDSDIELVHAEAGAF